MRHKQVISQRDFLEKYFSGTLEEWIESTIIPQIKAFIGITYEQVFCFTFH